MSLLLCKFLLCFINNFKKCVNKNILTQYCVKPFIYLSKKKPENSRSLLQSLMPKLKEKLKSTLQLQIKSLQVSQTEEISLIFLNLNPGKSSRTSLLINQKMEKPEGPGRKRGIQLIQL